MDPEPATLSTLSLTACAFVGVTFRVMIRDTNTIECSESYFEETEVDSMQALVQIVEEQTLKFARVA